MAERRGAVKFAYAVLASERTLLEPDLDVSHAPALPQIGDVLVFPTNRGIRVIDEPDTGGVPIHDVVHLHFIAEGRELPNGDVDFAYESRRLLALIQIGAQNERAVHQLVDQIFERFEAFLDAVGEHDTDEALSRLRKEFP